MNGLVSSCLGCYFFESSKVLLAAQDGLVGHREGVDEGDQAGTDEQRWCSSADSAVSAVLTRQTQLTQLTEQC